MEKNQKILYFQYTLHKLLLWFKAANGNEAANDISILKSLKLLFFVSSAKSNKDDNDSLVDSVFTSFMAMPYGHVESDIYDAIKGNNGAFEYFTVTNSNTTRNGQPISGLTSQLEERYTAKIDESVDFLKDNSNLILLSPFDLVELSHLWFSWRKNYTLAENEGKRSRDIPVADIKSETKIFNLQTF